ncbi:MAG: hypothetical protein DME22_26810 [Verrucomicrobia bacterium]|nr:MAG: hypothetical protein DME22_26810 [Verrucomicrobiota bacterium]PYJ97149.1 MAG: hypothetical protein DME23_17000 [Verrucomicrobiota bacterium]
MRAKHTLPVTLPLKTFNGVTNCELTEKVEISWLICNLDISRLGLSDWDRDIGHFFLEWLGRTLPRFIASGYFPSKQTFEDFPKHRNFRGYPQKTS